MDQRLPLHRRMMVFQSLHHPDSADMKLQSNSWFRHQRVGVQCFRDQQTVLKQPKKKLVLIFNASKRLSPKNCYGPHAQLIWHFDSLNGFHRLINLRKKLQKLRAAETQTLTLGEHQHGCHDNDMTMIYIYIYMSMSCCYVLQANLLGNGGLQCPLYN